MAASPPPPPQLTCEPLLTVRMVWVVSPQHPLATHGAPIPIAVLSEHIQLIHTDSADLRGGAAFPACCPRELWRLCHLRAKHGFLRAGLGFGMMPLHVVEADLSSGALVQIRVEDAPSDGNVIGNVSHLSIGKPAGAGRALVHRPPQTGRYAAAETESGAEDRLSSSLSQRILPHSSSTNVARETEVRYRHRLDKSPCELILRPVEASEFVANRTPAGHVIAAVCRDSSIYRLLEWPSL